MLSRIARCTFFALLSSALLCILVVDSSYAQGKQAIVILRSTGVQGGGCEGAAELNYHILFDVKLNNKDEIRLLSGLPTSQSSTISRKTYEDSRKRKIRDLFALKWSNNEILGGFSVSGQPALGVLPEDMKPQRGLDQPISSFYGAMLTGEAREGRQKRKVDIPLRSVLKVYFVSEGAPANDSLFNHAADEASVVLWETYLAKTGNYRSSEANLRMHEALMQCVRGDLKRFVDGDYGALGKARNRIGRIQSIKDDEVVRSLAAEVAREHQKVEDARNSTEQLIKADKWDLAIDAAEPIKKYLPTWPELDEMYNRALEGSHNVHLNAGNEAFLAGRLEASRDDCSIAMKRLPRSQQALDCVCRARIEIALRDSQKNRKINRPKDAKELLENQLSSECRQDPRLTVELRDSKCEYAQQLYDEARRLLGVGSQASPQPRRRAQQSSLREASTNTKPISMSNKKDFRDAREKLVMASELCIGDPIRSLLGSTNERLGGFCKDEARKAMQRNDTGTAYVYLLQAQGYLPGDHEASEMLARSREKFQEQTRVSIGVVFLNRSGNGYADGLLNEVAASIESASTQSGLSRVAVLSRPDAAASLRAIQAGRPSNAPTVIFFGDLLGASIRVDRNPSNVTSMFSYQNPERQRWDRNIDMKSREYNDCKKQYGEAQCKGISDERQRMRAYRDSLPRRLEQAYSYRQTDFRVQGATRLSFRSTDSVSRGTSAADTLSGEVSQECQQREGVHADDTRGVGNNICRINDEGFYLSEMFRKIRGDAYSRAIDILRSLPNSYYSQAQSAGNKQQAVESYLRFLFLTRNKSGPQAEQAKAFLIAYDPELRTDGVIR